MKKLLETKVQRGQILREWVTASEQATDDGRSDFAQRQRARLAAAQPKPEADMSNVSAIIPTFLRKRVKP